MYTYNISVRSPTTLNDIYRSAPLFLRRYQEIVRGGGGSSAPCTPSDTATVASPHAASADGTIVVSCWAAVDATNVGRASTAPPWDYPLSGSLSEEGFRCGETTDNAPCVKINDPAIEYAYLESVLNNGRTLWYYPMLLAFAVLQCFGFTVFWNRVGGRKEQDEDGGNKVKPVPSCTSTS